MKKKFTFYLALITSLGASTSFAGLAMAGSADKSLFHAIRDEGTEKVALLLESGAHMETVNERGMTPLHYAIEHGSKEVVDLLITKRANLEAMDGNGMTPLLWALYRHRKEIAYALIINDAHIETGDEDNITPLHVAAGGPLTEIVRFLINKGATIKAVDKNGMTPLHWAAMRGRRETVYLLIDSSADVSARDKEDRTPLHYAAQHGSTAVVNRLLNAGVEKEARTKKGQNPLHYALKGENVEVVKILLDANVRVDVDAFTLAIIEEQMSKNSEFIDMLLLGSMIPLPQDVIDLLIAHGFELRAIEKNFRRSNEFLQTYSTKVARVLAQLRSLPSCLITIICQYHREEHLLESSIIPSQEVIGLLTSHGFDLRTLTESNLKKSDELLQEYSTEITKSLKSFCSIPRRIGAIICEYHNDIGIRRTFFTQAKELQAALRENLYNQLV